MNAWWYYITHEINVSKEQDADLNGPKSHLMSHWVRQIRCYRAMQPCSAERHDQAHKTNLKDGWNTSKPNLNYLPQVMTYQRRTLRFEISELNLQAPAQLRENSTPACNVLPSGADLAAPIGSQLLRGYFKSQFQYNIYWTKYSHLSPCPSFLVFPDSISHSLQIRAYHSSLSVQGRS